MKAPEVQAVVVEDQNNLGALPAHRVILDTQSPKQGLQQHLALRMVEPQYSHNCYLKTLVSSSWLQIYHSVEE